VFGQRFGHESDGVLNGGFALRRIIQVDPGICF
jgi:hypothetical protein